MGHSFLTPGKTTGNLLRFRPPWYRDSRTVKADSFWSDPAPATFFPRSRVQPFLSNNAGFIYFANGMLTPEGSKLVYTVDFGAGVNIFRKR